MTQNKNKLIELFTGNIANAVVHSILEKSLPMPELIGKYRHESMISFEIAKRYREKINPADNILPAIDAEKIKDKIIRKVKSELGIRISKGYKDIKLELVEEETIKLLKEANILE